MSLVLALKVRKGKVPQRGNDHFWSVIMERHRAGQSFSVRDIDAASDARITTIRDFVQRLVKAGLVEEAEAAAVATDTRYRPLVIQSAAPRVRRDGSMIESQPATRCMWNLMRGPVGRAGFTYRDLVAWSQTDETPISVHTAKSYIKLLRAAGYLIQVDPGKPGTPATWRLDPLMNTGPRAPMILRTRLVYDPNRQEVFGPAEAEEVQL
ncbi:hypothetical protein [Shinella sp.]|uniref:hypothetical protein n=1 Tax=Shinella sp. TaxID=1870904 RepID=UPI0039E4D0C0